MSSIFENDSVYKISDSFTMRNIMNIVEKMNVAIPHHEFEPEPISEGGIRVKLDGGGYKTFRFNFHNWPYFGRYGVKNEDLDIKLIVNDFTGKGRMYSHFRTLYGAPEWTKDEIKCINKIISEEGMKKVRV